MASLGGKLLQQKYSEKKYNLIQKLHFRQLYGKVQNHSHAAQMPLFKQLPSRLAFPLHLLAPRSALFAGHIFLGFTKCGQFLLSYTHSTDTDDATFQVTQRYRLHWWLFIPYAPLKKIAEVLLFGDQDVHGDYECFSISVCQWPNDLTKVLVYGCSVADDSENSNSRRCYITITAVPSLNGCPACFKVATSYEEEEIAEQWNGCLRFNCLKHGYTVHTSFEMVPPYPRFLPSVQLKYRDIVVLNSGNFIHVLHITLENIENAAETVSTTAALYNRVAPVVRMETMNDDDESAGETQSVHPEEDEEELDREVVEMESVSRRLRSSTAKRKTLEAESTDDLEQGESSSSDTEFERNPRRSIIDRRTLSVEDRDREWELLISNVPPRTSLGHLSNINNNLDTDSASDAEVCANDSSGLSEELNLSLRFDLLKNSANYMNANSSTSNSVASSSSSVVYGSSLITKRSKVLHSANIRDKISLNKSAHTSHFDTPSSSSNTQCVYNYDSDDSTICIQQSDNLTQTESDGELFTSPDPGYQYRARRSATVADTSESNVMRLRSGEEYLRPQPQNDRYESADGNLSPSNSAESEYEFIDEIAGSRHEKLSVFRKRRLADKKYEFSDENSENVPADYRSFRTQRCHSVLVVPSPAVSPRNYSATIAVADNTSGGEGLLRTVYERLLSPVNNSPNDVLRPINQNISSPILSPRDDLWTEWDKFEKNGFQFWGSHDNLSLVGVSTASMSPSTHASTDGVGGSSAPNQNPPCVVDINRRYIEVDDELVSIITDIEDDELSSSTGYHCALQMEVHGTGYAQMHMISNSKADKLLMPGLRVRQISLDVEQFCHGTAHALCKEANKKYSCCCDYNVEIVDVCPDTGNIVAVASLLVQADNLPSSSSSSSSSTSTKTRVTRQTSAYSSAPSGSDRTLYKATSTFVFSIETKQHYVIDKQPLQEEGPFLISRRDDSNNEQERRWWQSGAMFAQQLRSLATRPTSYYSSVKVLNNDALCQGRSLRCIMEGQHLMAVVMSPLSDRGSLLQ